MTALGPFTIDMYLPALPDIGADLGVSSSTVQLTITGTLIGLALGQLLVGPLSDTLGRKKPLLAGIGVHILASLLAVFAPSIAVLGILRVFQGMGAAAAAVVTMAIVRDLYSGNTVAVVMSRLMLVLGVAPILAPSIGGALLVALDWRGIFVVLALIGVGTAMIGVGGAGLVVAALLFALVPGRAAQSPAGSAAQACCSRSWARRCARSGRPPSPAASDGAVQ
mgnify:CR=1 FL=1